jgi:hypothetical protein
MNTDVDATVRSRGLGASCARVQAAAADLRRFVRAAASRRTELDRSERAALAQVRATLESLVRAIDELHLPGLGADAFASLSEASVDAMLAKLMGESLETGSPRTVELTGAEAMAVPSPAEAADAAGALPEPPVREPVPADRLLQTLLEEVDGPVSLQGEACTLPIATLVNMLAGSLQSGSLHLRRVDEHLRFVFEDGRIVATWTDHAPPSQRLGSILVAQGALTQERCDALLAAARARGSAFGAVALQAGAIDPDQLAEALRAQVQARFDRVFDDPHVAYAFRASREDAGAYRLDVDARQMVFESARRSDERSDLRA